MQEINIKELKNSYRIKSKEYRKSLDSEHKKELDLKIINNLLNLDEVKKSTVILSYVSTRIEIETDCFLNKMLMQNKCVAVPKCVENTRNMNFYMINSLSDTFKQSFGVREPNKNCPKLDDFENSVCIIPALMFDKEGFRLGYGKGYYDRFLSDYKGLKIGLCYQNCLVDKLPHGFFDVAVDIIVTENEVIYI
jgi:5-formyltetrahydrofolate cyclo-ligase